MRDILCLVVTCDSEHNTGDNANIEEPTRYLMSLSDAKVVAAATADTKGRRNVEFESDCRCRNSQPEMDAATSWGTANRSPRTYVQPSRSAGPVRRETTVTAGNTRMSSIPVFITPPPVPGGVASGQTHQNVHNLVPLLPSSVRKYVLVRCPVNSGRVTAAKTPPGSWAAGVHELECATTPAGATC